MVLSSTDGFCSLVAFDQGELGLIQEPATKLVETMLPETPLGTPRPVVPTSVDLTSSKVKPILLQSKVEEKDIIMSQCDDDAFSTPNASISIFAHDDSVKSSAPDGLNENDKENLVAKKKRIVPIFLGPNV